jgi:hypothetical protein
MDKKEYHRKYHKEWYLKNGDVRRQQIRDRKTALKKWLREYKKTLKCNRCSEDHPATICFHHKDSTKKDIAIGNAGHYGWSKKRILKEIDKCEVLCANCHTKEHWDE